MRFPQLAQGSLLIIGARTDRVTEEQYAYMQRWMDNEERTRLTRFRFVKNRQEYLLAHGLARWMLANITGQAPEQVQICREKYGKPYIDYPNNLGFNWAHCDGAVACAVALNARVGVDVEPTKRQIDILEFAKNYCSEDEWCALSLLPREDAESMFMSWWTLKEALMKANGRGLGIHPASICCAGAENAGYKELLVSPDTHKNYCAKRTEGGVFEAWRSHWISWCDMTNGAAFSTCNVLEWDAEDSLLPISLEGVWRYDRVSPSFEMQQRSRW